MTDRICSVQDCELQVRARGWCVKHYNEWRKANPDAVGTYRRRSGTCSIEGCAARDYRRGMCRPHDRALTDHGTVNPRRRAQVVNGKRICPRCKVDQPLDLWGAAGICKPCNRDHVKPYIIPAPTRERQCKICEATYLGTKRQSATCSDACRIEYKKRCDAEFAERNYEAARAAKDRWRKANPEKTAEKERRRNARKRGATIGPVDLDALWTGLCGICGGPLDRTLSWPHGQSKSLDHIQPLSRGGSHTQPNLQWTHLQCNIRKGAKLDYLAPRGLGGNAES